MNNRPAIRPATSLTLSLTMAATRSTPNPSSAEILSARARRTAASSGDVFM